jgi:hypothetical protein
LSLDIIAQLWAAGASFTDMALKLGESRGVIAGRIDRARKSGDPRFTPRPPKPREKPITLKPLIARPPVVAAPTRPKPFAKLQPGECSWPLNNPERGGVFLCCAAPVAKPRAVYCAEHIRVSSSTASSPSFRAPSPAETFALAGEDEETIADLEARIAQLEEQLKAAAR